MSWLVVATIAYFLLALVNVADKFVLERVIPGPRVYAFLVGVTGLAVFVLAPWFLEWPGWDLFLFNLLTGSFFAGGLLFMYSALKRGEASRIFTLVGGIVPIFTIILSVIYFDEVFTNYQWLAILFLVAGTLVIANISYRHSVWFNIRKFLTWSESNKLPALMLAIIASMLFAFFWVGSKIAYNEQSFMSAFIWIRLGTFVAVLFLLVSKDSRQRIINGIKKSNEKKSNRFVYFGTQIAGAVGSLMQNYAVALGSVALVASLQGMQYGLLLILTALITVFRPGIIKEDNSGRIIWQKVAAIVLIAIGLYFITI